MTQPSAQRNPASERIEASPRSRRAERSRGAAPAADDLERACARLRAERDEAEQTVRELRKELQSRDDFIATAGHELRNPMAAILLTVGNLRTAAARDGLGPAWLSPRLDALERHSRRFVRRATALLDVARVASGVACLSRERMDLGAIAAEMVGEFAEEAERARCPLACELRKGVFGDWDRSAVEGIVYNLLSNALKYGAGKPVSVRVAVEGGCGVLVVRDQGSGISPADVARIFERFERASARPDRPGFGVGLWIARSFALAHGGDITVESACGAGTAFTARLPLAGVAQP